MPEEGGQPALGHPDLQPAPTPVVESADNPPERFFVGGRERTLEEVQRDFEQSRQEVERRNAETATWRAQAEANERVAQAYKEMLSTKQEPASLPDGIDPGVAQWLDQRVEQLATSRATEIAEQKAKEATAGLTQFVEGLQKLQVAQTNIKSADNSFDPTKLSEFLTSHPDVQQRYNRMLAVDQEAALDFAWTKAKQTGEAPSSRAVQMQPRQKGQQVSADSVRARDLEAARVEAEATGNYEKFYALRFSGTSVDRRGDFEQS